MEERQHSLRPGVLAQRVLPAEATQFRQDVGGPAEGQVRAAERILFSALLTPGRITLSNTHFDTTRANVELTGCQAVDLPCPQARDLDSDEPFKGNIDLHRLEEALRGPALPRRRHPLGGAGFPLPR
ncbi:beta-eliminating lyase-related protein [Streptomyces massasporeus]|uniref:beta-eliminating lyase-related protein n=1 Tax=Streptomyces massasporeus TaxID=67324 RepID=UPI0033E18972